MASLAEMKKNEDFKFNQTLEDAGMDLEMAHAIINNPHLAEVAVNAVRRELGIPVGKVIYILSEPQHSQYSDTLVMTRRVYARVDARDARPLPDPGDIFDDHLVTDVTHNGDIVYVELKWR